MEDEPVSVPVERTGPAPLLRIGLVGAAAAALVAVGILAATASATPGGILAANPGASSSPAAGVPGNGPGRGPGGWRMGGRGGGMSFGGITITAISGSRISLKTPDGWIRTITIDGSTTYPQNGATAALSDLKVGDEIQFRETRGTGGTYSINAISVVAPHAGGTISSISGSTLKVTLPDGTSTTITVGSATTYDVGGNRSAKLSDLKTGMIVTATGTRAADGSLAATAVRAFDPSTMPMKGFGDFDHGIPGMGPNANPNAPATPSSTGTSNG